MKQVIALVLSFAMIPAFAETEWKVAPYGSDTSRPTWPSGRANVGDLCEAQQVASTSVTSYHWLKGKTPPNGIAAPCKEYTVVVPPPPETVLAPEIFYTDIVSGPNTGGESGYGAFITIFGREFGADSSAGIVSIGGLNVAAVKSWSPNSIVVQPGPAVSSGNITVTVSGKQSNAVRFTVVPGTIKFLNPGDVVQTAVNAMQPGDFLILRGGTYTDSNPRYRSWFSLQDGKGGTADAPLTVACYPGEFCYVPRPTNTDTTANRGVHLYNSPGGLVVTGFSINMQGGRGTPFGWPPGAAAAFGNTMQYIRATNNEITGMVNMGSGSAAMEGRGRHIKYIGNSIHHNGVMNGVGSSSKLYHSIYFDNNDRNGTDDIEIAYNLIQHQGGGRGIQIYNSNSECGTTTISNVSVHHNIVHDIALDGILFSDCTGAGNKAYNNVVYRTAVKAYQTDGISGHCFRFNNAKAEVELYDNQLSDCMMDAHQDSAVLLFQAQKAITSHGNTFNGTRYYLPAGMPPGVTSVGDTWVGGGAMPAWAQ